MADQRRSSPEARAVRAYCRAENSAKTRVMAELAELRRGLKPAARVELRALPLRDLRELVDEERRAQESRRW